MTTDARSLLPLCLVSASGGATGRGFGRKSWTNLIARCCLVSIQAASWRPVDASLGFAAPISLISPYVWINVKRARELNIKDGDWVCVSSPRGHIEAKAETTTIIGEECIYVPGGWAQANYNELGIDDALDPVSSQANYTTCLGNIEKREGVR